MELIGLIFSMALTLMVLSYILGDNPLFRVAEHIFVGASVAYAILVVWHQVLVPAFASGGGSAIDLAAKIPPALLCFLLIFKIQPRQSTLSSSLGSIALAFLVGVGAALAIGGALFGTLWPQVMATAAIDFRPSAPAYADAPGSVFFDNDFLSNIVVLLGTVGTLFYFTFAYRPKGFLGGFREMFVNLWAGMGRWVILITLGALFSNTVSARIALLLSRVQFLADGIQEFQRLISR